METAASDERSAVGIVDGNCSEDDLEEVASLSDVPVAVVVAPPESGCTQLRLFFFILYLPSVVYNFERERNLAVLPVLLLRAWELMMRLSAYCRLGS